MDSIPILKASHSHLFRGARLHHDDDLQLSDAPQEILVIFSDGAEAEASIRTEDDHVLIGVEPYATEAGTTLDAKSWIAVDDGGDRLRVVEKDITD